MATIRAYTTIEQSRKLAEILPLESADMSWVSCDDGRQKYYQAENRKIILNYEKKHWLYCWSLAALLNVLPHIQEFYPIIAKINDKYVCRYESSGIWTNGDNPVDACVAMIEKLNELNLL
jgi:hypothetical protein